MPKTPLTESQMKADIAQVSGLSKADVDKVFKATQQVVGEELKAAGKAKVPGVATLVVKRKPATKAHRGINPFTKEEQMFKARPARNVVKARASAKIKDYV